MEKGAVAFRLMIMLGAMAVSGVTGQNEAVLDVNGKPVTTNTSYYLKAWHVRKPLGISRITRSLTPFTNKCPEGPVLDIYIHLPTSFISSSDNVLRLTAEVNIKFNRRNHCNESGIWRPLGNGHITLTGSSNDSESMFTFANKDIVGNYFLYYGSYKPNYVKNRVGIEHDILLHARRLKVRDLNPVTFSFAPV